MVTNFDPHRFRQDYAKGVIAENAFAQQCEIWDLDIISRTPKSVFPDYDFIIQYRGTREKKIYSEVIELPPTESYEIKGDFIQSDNVSVQFYSSSKKETDNYLPSSNLPCNAGLFKTKSDFYCVFNPHDMVFYIAPSHLLREYLRKSPQLKKVIANKHKSEQTGIVLIPKVVWMKEFYHLPYTLETYTEIQ